MFKQTLSSNPVVFAGIETFDGGDTAGIRMRNLSSTSVEVRIEEEQSEDSETAHTTEVVGFFALESGAILDNQGSLIGEAGLTSSGQINNGSWKTITLSKDYNSPVVIMNILTANGYEQSHIRLRNVKANSFQYQIEEWDYLDQAHGEELISYLVIEEGVHSLNDGRKIQVGVVGNNQKWKTVTFPEIFGRIPVTLSQSQTYNGGQAIVTRQKNVSSSKFDVRLQEEEGNDGFHWQETIGYVAIEVDL
ncbi:hypothetical protein MNBD_UNCLBAC01-1435 [hydrothermal vent metagenome]|uniref:Uncharacterized protein n=1 Tax=hydrothermal vent metagenome TaxID=652676 RepID=A0A3B1DJS9_9ZZZZ